MSSTPGETESPASRHVAIPGPVGSAQLKLVATFWPTRYVFPVTGETMMAVGGPGGMVMALVDRVTAADDRARPSSEAPAPNVIAAGVRMVPENDAVAPIDTAPVTSQKTFDAWASLTSFIVLDAPVRERGPELEDEDRVRVAFAIEGQCRRRGHRDRCSSGVHPGVERDPSLVAGEVGTSRRLCGRGRAGCRHRPLCGCGLGIADVLDAVNNTGRKPHQRGAGADPEVSADDCGAGIGHCGAQNRVRSCGSQSRGGRGVRRCRACGERDGQQAGEQQCAGQSGDRNQRTTSGTKLRVWSHWDRRSSSHKWRHWLYES